MGVLNLNLVGANAYVPHTDGKALLAVMPNASRLGISASGALDGTLLTRHVPFIWEETVNADGVVSVSVPQVFLGARLAFNFDVSPALDLSAIMPIAQAGWMDLDDAVLRASSNDRVSGQIVITSGVVGILRLPPPSCNPAWSRANFPYSLSQVVPGLTIKIDNVTSVSATAATWVGAGEHPMYSRLLKNGEEVQIYLGNLCAEDVLDWPRNSLANRAHDNDFKWIYGLSKHPELPEWVAGGLPVPIVRGSGIQETDVPSVAFSSFWGGGGGAGCECNGCVDKPRTFSY